MTDPLDDHPLRGSDRRFARDRAALTDALDALLGPHTQVEPLRDADDAARLASEARASHQDASPHAWALVRHAWSGDDREGVVEVLHAIGARLISRPAWLVVPGREPQVVPLSTDVVLDNPLGFTTLAGHELLLLDRELPAGLWLWRRLHEGGAARGATIAWELELWGEPWLSAATRAIRELRRD